MSSADGTAGARRGEVPPRPAPGTGAAGANPAGARRRPSKLARMLNGAAWFVAPLLVLVVAPFFTNFLIRTLAWQIILTDQGPVAQFFRSTGLTTVLQAVGLTENDSLLNSQFAVISGLIYNFLPFMVLPPLVLYAIHLQIDYLTRAAGPRS